MKKLTVLLCSLLLGYNAYSQTPAPADDGGGIVKTYTARFSQLDSCRNSRESIEALSKFNESTDLTITEVTISAYTSPEGSVSFNENLSRKRVHEAFRILDSVIMLPIDNMHFNYVATDWELFKKYVSESELNDTQKDAVYSVVDNNPVEVWKVLEGNTKPTMVDSRNRRLMDLNYGRTFNYLYKNVYPKMRVSEIYITYQSVEPIDFTPASQVGATSTENEYYTAPPSVTIHNEGGTSSGSEMERPLFAIKTNLLFLAAGVANIGAEVSVGKQMSIDVPFTYSPYTIKNDYKVRVLAVQPEFRYWLGRGHKGHFFGANVGAAWYNVAFDNTKRYQSNEALLSAGLSYGYRLHFSRHWAAEFTIGAGYATTSYDVFYNIDNGALMESSTKDYWGITKAGISLVYTFNFINE